MAKKKAAKKKATPKKKVGAYLFGGMAGKAARAANKRKKRLDKI